MIFWDFLGLCGEHSAWEPCWPRCTRAGKYKCELDVDDFAPGPFQLDPCSRFWGAVSAVLGDEWNNRGSILNRKWSQRSPSEVQKETRSVTGTDGKRKWRHRVYPVIYMRCDTSCDLIQEKRAKRWPKNDNSSVDVNGYGGDF